MALATQDEASPHHDPSPRRIVTQRLPVSAVNKDADERRATAGRSSDSRWRRFSATHPAAFPGNPQWPAFHRDAATSWRQPGFYALTAMTGLYRIRTGFPFHARQGRTCLAAFST